MASASGPGPGRLTRRSEFLAAAKGRRFHTELVSVQSRYRDELPNRDQAGEVRDARRQAPASAGLRVGLTVTKREGHATERNRMRRRLRAAVKLVGAGHADLPADVVVIARRAILSAGFDRLVDDLGRALRAVGQPPRRLDAGLSPAGLADGTAPPDVGRGGRSRARAARPPQAAPDATRSQAEPMRLEAGRNLKPTEP